MKKKKKKKLRVKNFLRFLLIVLILGFIFFILINIKVKTFYITNNKYLTEEEVLKELKLNDNSSFLLTNEPYLKTVIRKSKTIKSLSIKRDFNLELTIKINEYRKLFYDGNLKKVVLENNNKIDSDKDNLPVLVNKIEDKNVYNSFVKKMKKVDDNTLGMISEISYSPNGIDKERFLFSMNDGNYVYVTLTKLKKINEYKSILQSVENKKGILYLDYGNYFVPKE